MKLFATLASAAMAATLLVGAAQASILAIFPDFRLGPYAGVRGGYSTSNDAVLGANLGYDLGLLRAELDYDRLGFRTTSSNVVTANGIFQYPLADFTPYALAGFGYQWRNTTGYFADTASWSQGSALWNVGVGVRYNITDFVELDGRYRYIEPFSVSADLAHPYQKGVGYSVVTTGVNFRF